MPIKQVELALIADFAPQLSGREIVSVGVGPQGEALILATTTEAKETALERYVQPGWASFPMSKVSPYRADILTFTPYFRSEIALEVEEGHPFVQPLPNREILVVAARCKFRDGNPEQNAAVYDGCGALLRRFVMGDGLHHVMTTHSGIIWAAYGDEGIFGNYGWKKPLGAAGILQFDAEGEVLWRFEPPTGYDMIADCYGFNVASDAVWAYTYMNFPVTRIEHDGYRRVWQNEFTGARAIVSDNHRVLLFGGYKGNRTRCVVQDLGDNKMINAREIELVSPNGEDLQKAYSYGRGSVLHFFLGTSWYQFDLAQYDI